MKLYVPLDVDFQVDPKIIAAGPLAECLFVRSLALAKRMMKDGRIDAHHLPHLALGLPGRPQRHAQTLVDVGLWSPIDGGWQIVAWLKRNSSAELVNERQEAKRLAAVKANHARWHGKERAPDCPLCYPNRIVNGERSESTKTETETESKGEEKVTAGISGDDDSETTPDPSSSSISEPDRQRQRRSIALATARHLAQHRPDLRNPAGWVQETAKHLLDERRPDIDRCIDLRYTVDLAAQLVATGTPPAGPPRPPDPAHDPDCSRCAGSGWATILDEKGDPTNDVSACDCEPPIATIHPIHGGAA